MTGILKVDTILRNDGSVPTAADLGLNVTGTILKSETFHIPSSGTNLSVSADLDVEWWSRSFTTIRNNSKILITYHSGQIANSTTTIEMNARMRWSVNSTTIDVNMDIWRDHNHEWYVSTPSISDRRFFITGQALTSSLSVGTHTIRCFAGAYNTGLTFGYQGESNPPHRLGIITFQEIAG